MHSYVAMLYLGIVAGIAGGNLAAHAAHVDAFRVYAATFILIVPAIIGARLLHAVHHWELYRGNLRRIWDRSQGGAAQYGALFFALPLSVPLVTALHLPLGQFWDVVTFTILVAMIFGRVGCLMNGCCAGLPSNAWYSVYLPNHSGVWKKRIPTQCLEAFWALVLLALAIAMWRRMPFPGALFLAVTAAYAAMRLVLESTREQQPGTPRFTVHHWISAALIVFSLATLTAHWARV